MATVPSPVVDSQPHISPLGRVIGIFFAPKKTFEDIVRKPGWLAPLIVLFLTGVLLNYALVTHANWTEVVKEQIAKSKFASTQFDKMDAAQKEKEYEKAADRTKTIRYVRAVIGWPLLLLVSTVFYFAAYCLVGGGRITFGISFVIVTFASLPMAVKEILGAVVAWFKDPNAIDPDNYLASNPAVLLGPDAPTWQMVPLVFLDIFAIWVLILVAVGFTAADPKKLPFGKSLGISIGLHLLFLSLFTGLAWMLS